MRSSVRTGGLATNALGQWTAGSARKCLRGNTSDLLPSYALVRLALLDDADVFSCGLPDAPGEQQIDHADLRNWRDGHVFDRIWSSTCSRIALCEPAHETFEPQPPFVVLEGGCCGLDLTRAGMTLC
jgi:hypothetical protein